jgi:hypothetical protein
VKLDVKVTKRSLEVRGKVKRRLEMVLVEEKFE